jgi:hypothetical protein
MATAEIELKPASGKDLSKVEEAKVVEEEIPSTSPGAPLDPLSALVLLSSVPTADSMSVVLRAMRRSIPEAQIKEAYAELHEAKKIRKTYIQSAGGVKEYQDAGNNVVDPVLPLKIMAAYVDYHSGSNFESGCMQNTYKWIQKAEGKHRMFYRDKPAIQSIVTYMEYLGKLIPEEWHDVALFIANELEMMKLLMEDEKLKPLRYGLSFRNQDYKPVETDTGWDWVLKNVKKEEVAKV